MQVTGYIALAIAIACTVHCPVVSAGPATALSVGVELEAMSILVSARTVLATWSTVNAKTLSSYSFASFRSTSVYHSEWWHRS